MIGFLLSFGLVAQDFELVKPESFAIRRFNEVIQAQIKENEKDSPSEALIALRAQVAVAERQLERIRQAPADQTAAELNRPNSEQAARALLQHYQKLLTRLETNMKKKKP